MASLLLSPPAVFVAFLVLALALYWLGGRIAAHSPESEGKHQPYASGEDLAPSRARVAYHSFFRLALIFGILHLATLVISTVPQGGITHRPALLYLVAIAISVFVLTKGED